MARRADLSERSASFVGVIWSRDGWRVAVSSRGASYLLQSQEPDGSWRRRREFPNRGWLLMHCDLVEEMPGDLLDMVRRLPESPADSPQRAYGGPVGPASPLPAVRVRARKVRPVGAAPALLRGSSD